MKQIPVPTQSWTFLPPKLSKNINGGERESAQVQEAGSGSLEPAGRPLLACDASSFAEKKTRRRNRSGAGAWDAPRLRQLGPSGGRRSREDWAAALGLGPSPLSLSRAGGGKGRRGLVPYRPGSILNVPFCGHRTHEVLTNSVIMLMC